MKPAFAKATADEGGLAQLARALALQARGHRFDSDILHDHGLNDLNDFAD